MTEYEIHMMIEKQNPEAKQRVWNKIKEKLAGGQIKPTPDSTGTSTAIFRVSVKPYMPQTSGAEKTAREIGIYLDMYSTKRYKKGEIIKVNGEEHQVCDCWRVPTI